MTWTATFSRAAEKQAKKLPDNVQTQLKILVLEIQAMGPVRGNWKNYSTLANGDHHCHLKKGNPTYVAVWRVTDKTVKLVEIRYAGTHEKAPY
jgi:mRNA-degrading endonuclease RelE of RelBE toxin-antitoxin system